MKYTKLGKSDLTVSRICMGCIEYLEELYVPYALVGVMAQNGKQKAGNVV